MEKKFRFTVLMVLALAVGLAAGVANAELLLYEGFDYTAGTDIESKDGGTGWDGPWLREGEPMPATIAAGSLVHHGVATSGEKLYLQQNDLDEDEDETSGIARSLPGDGLLDDGSTYWVSFLIQKEDPNNTGAYLGMIVAGELRVGKPWDGEMEAPDDEDNLGFDSWGATASGPVTTSTPATTLSWYVAKLETADAGNSTVYVWIDPPLSTAEPDTASPDATGSYGTGDTTEISLEWGETEGDGTGLGRGWIDEIRIGTSWEDVAVNPKLASNPQPEGGEINVDPALALLEWTAPTVVVGPPVEYDVYFGTYYWGEPDPNFITANPKIKDNAVGTSVEPNDPAVEYALAMGTQYYWRVDPRDPGATTGFVWTFTTWPTVPIIKTQPAVVQTVAAGSSASFTCEGGGNLAGAHTYTWYKQVGATQNPGSDTEVKAETGPKAGPDTYTDADVQLGDEGYYYCKVSNASGPAYSDSGRLLTERKMAHWKFQNNLNDETGNYNATSLVAPSYPDGIDGKAVQIIDDPNEFVMVDGTIGLLNDITVSMWVEPNKLDEAVFFVPQTGDEQDRKDEDYYGGTGADYGGTSAFHLVAIHSVEDPAGTLIGNVIDSMEANLDGFVSDVTAGVPDALTANEWNHIAFVYDTTNQVARYHVNGNLMKAWYYAGDEQHQSIDGAYERAIDADVLPNVLPLGIGARSVEEPGDIFDWGLIDDVRVYNYPLSPLEIAQLYNAFAAVDTDCFRPVEGDLSGDCKLDLVDYTEWADSWLLEYNIVPDHITPVMPD